MDLLPPEVVQCVMAACDRHEDRHSLSCASRKFSGVYTDPNTWKLMSNWHWPGCIRDTSEGQKRLMHFAVRQKNGEQAENWRLYFHLRTCLDNLCRYMNCTIDYNLWDDAYLEQFLDRPVTTLFSDPCPLDKDIAWNITPNIAFDIAKTTFFDHGSFWGALFRLVVAILIRSPSSEVQTAVVRILLRSLFSQGRAKPHVRFVLSLAVAKFANIIVPVVATSGVIHPSYMGAICSCLNFINRHSDAINVREIVCGIWTKELQEAIHNNTQLAYLARIAQRENLLRELSSAEAGDGPVTAKFRDLLLLEMSKLDKPLSSIVLLAVYCCGTFPLDEKSLQSWKQAFSILYRHGDEMAIQSSFVFFSGHALHWASKDAGPIRSSVAIIFEELEQYLRVETDKSRSLLVCEAAVKGVGLLVGPEVNPPVIGSLKEISGVWPSKVQAIIDLCSSTVVADADKNPDADTLLLSSSLVNLSDLVPIQELEALPMFSSFRSRLTLSTLRKLEQGKKLFRQVPDCVAVSRLLSMASTSSFSANHLTSLVKMMNVTDAYESHSALSFSLPLLESLVTRDDWNDLLDRLDELQQRLMTDTIVGCFGSETDPKTNSTFLEVLGYCEQFSQEAFRVIWTKVSANKLLNPKNMLHILRIASRFAMESPDDFGAIMLSPEASQLRRLFFCLPPTLDTADVIQDLSLRGILSLLQASKQHLADALLDAMKDEWKSDGAQPIESSSFSDVDFVSAMMKPLPKEDEHDGVIIASPTLEQQRRWLQLILSTISKHNSKLKMLVMMRLP